MNRRSHLHVCPNCDVIFETNLLLKGHFRKVHGRTKCRSCLKRQDNPVKREVNKPSTSTPTGTTPSTTTVTKSSSTTPTTATTTPPTTTATTTPTTPATATTTPPPAFDKKDFQFLNYSSRQNHVMNEDCCDNTKTESANVKNSDVEEKFLLIILSAIKCRHCMFLATDQSLLDKHIVDRH